MRTSKRPKSKSFVRACRKAIPDNKYPDINSDHLLNALFNPALVLDRKAKIMAANDAFCQLFLIQSTSICGQIVYELCDGAWDMPGLHDFIDQILLAASVPDDIEVEHVFPVLGMRRMRLRGRKIPDSNPKGGCIILIIEDITERERIMLELQKAAFEWRRTFDSIGDQIALLDTESRIVRANKAFFDAIKKSPKEVIGKKCHIFLHGAEKPVAGCPFRVMLNDKNAHTIEMTNQDGAVWLVTVSPVLDSNQQVMGAVHIAKDISERKRVEEQMLKTGRELQAIQSQLAESEKLAAVGQLVAGVAHEINNPIGFVSGNLEVLRHYVGVYLKMLGFMVKLREAVDKRAWDEAEGIIADIRKYEVSAKLDYMIEDCDQLLQQSQDGIKRIEKIVWDLRTFAREEPAIRRETVRIEEVVDRVLAIMRHDMKGRIELHKDYGDTPLVDCNAQKMGQVFMNLLINARQAMREKGIIEIKTYTKDSHVCVDIRDNGCGIPPENMSKIFDPFFTTKPAGSGTGLGLGISQDIVQKHGGDIRVASEVGKGATFTVMLPLSASLESKNKGSSLSLSRQADGRKAA